MSETRTKAREFRVAFEDGLVLLRDAADATKALAQALGMIKALCDEGDALESENTRLAGIQPELPPYPPEGDGLPRYGIRWNGPTSPLAVPMSDGYWTPWHLATGAPESKVNVLRGEVRDERIRRQTVEQDRDSARAERDAARQEVARLRAWGMS